MFHISWSPFSVQKFGNRPGDNEDSVSPRKHQTNQIIKRRFTCALSDGATSASFSSLWARLLVKYSTRKSIGNIEDSIHEAQLEWSSTIKKIPLPWFAEEKVKQGAFATLVLLNTWLKWRNETNKWKALIIGDSCLFHFRNRNLLKYYPPLHSTDFGNNPTLISSLSTRNREIWETIQSNIYEGSWESGDHFFLMTDALSAWFIREIEQGNNPYNSLIEPLEKNIMQTSFFSEFITDLRNKKFIKNDDTTLAWLTVYQ